MSLPVVDPRRVFLWGMSLGGTVSAVAAIVDRRVAGVLMVCPIFHFVRPGRRARAFAQLMRDRTSQLRGNEPHTFNSKGENPIGMAGAGGPGGREAYLLMRTAVERGRPNFRDRITLQTYHKLALFQPLPLMDLLEEVPVMMMVPELDDMSPAEKQQEAFARVRVPKRMHFAKGRGHMTILTGEGTEDIFEAMVGFFDDMSASRFVTDP